MKTITVYGAASNSVDPTFYDAARQLGAIIARNGYACANGGGKMGLMGAANDGALSVDGGQAIGVLPRFMAERGWAHPGLTRVEVVDTMRDRKRRMMELAEGVGVIAMPGGIGTFEELFEALTQRQLGLWRGNIVLLNTNGFYDKLIDVMRQATADHFMRQDHLDLLFSVADTPQAAFDMVTAPILDHDFTRKF